MTGGPALAAVVFDMDGLLVDSKNGGVGKRRRSSRAWPLTSPAGSTTISTPRLMMCDAGVQSAWQENTAFGERETAC